MVHLNNLTFSETYIFVWFNKFLFQIFLLHVFHFLLHKRIIFNQVWLASLGCILLNSVRRLSLFLTCFCVFFAFDFNFWFFFLFENLRFAHQFFCVIELRLRFWSFSRSSILPYWDAAAHLVVFIICYIYWNMILLFL